MTARFARDVRLLVFLFVVALLVATPASALNVIVKAHVEGDEKPIVVGSTNLPESTELMITVSRKESDYRAQDKTKVSNGVFRAGPFSRKGSALNPGLYKIEVLSPIAAVQCTRSDRERWR